MQDLISKQIRDDLIPGGERKEIKAIVDMPLTLEGPEKEFFGTFTQGSTGRPVDVYTGLEGHWKISGQKPLFLKVKLIEQVDVGGGTIDSRPVQTEGILKSFCKIINLKHSRTDQDSTLYVYFAEALRVPRGIVSYERGVGIAVLNRPIWKPGMIKESGSLLGVGV